MELGKTPSAMTRLTGKLPPSGPLPAALQTVGCRWFAFRYFEMAHERFGDRFCVYPLYMPPLVFLSDPEDIRSVLTADPAVLHPGSGSGILTPLIGKRSFMLLEEDEHIISRKTVTPAFHQGMVRDQAAIVHGIVESEIAGWPLNTTLALHPRIRAMTLRVILKVIFGEQDETLEDLHAVLMAMLTVTTSFLLQEPKLQHVPGWRSIWRRFVQQRDTADRLIYALMRRRRAQSDSQQTDLLNMLLAGEQTDGSPMTEAEIRDHLMSMILAGHETTTGELTWAFQLLAHNQRVQDRLREEIDSGTEEQYLSATVNETMRRKPVFLFVIPREVVEPIEVGGRVYRPPVHLAGCTYLMHHNPELYPKPYEFRPERFIDEHQQPRTWLPWGGGRKHCLGRHFALMEVKAILREVLATRQVLPASRHIEEPRWRSAILVPRDGGQVILRDRRRRS
jgi:cytochrome P450